VKLPSREEKSKTRKMPHCQGLGRKKGVRRMLSSNWKKRTWNSLKEGVRERCTGENGKITQETKYKIVGRNKAFVIACDTGWEREIGK